MAVRDRVAAGVRKLDRIEIPGPKPTKKDGANVRCFSSFSSEEQCKRTHFSFKRCTKCLMEKTVRRTPTISNSNRKDPSRLSSLKKISIIKNILNIL